MGAALVLARTLVFICFLDTTIYPCSYCALYVVVSAEEKSSVLVSGCRDVVGFAGGVGAAGSSATNRYVVWVGGILLVGCLCSDR